MQKPHIPEFPRQRRIARAATFTLLLTVFVALGCTNLATSTSAAPITSGSRFAVLPHAFFAVRVAPSTKADIASISTSMVGSVVEVQATVQSISRPREGSRAPVRVSLSDESGRITMIIWQDTFEVVQSRHNPAANDLVRVRATVSEFKGEVQLTLKNVDDMQVLSKGGAAAGGAKGLAGTAHDKPTTPLAHIDTSMLGQEVVVQASIINVREPREGSRAPYNVTLSQDGATLPMVFWTDEASRVPQVIRVGSTVRARVTVNEYRGALQLKLADLANVSVLPAGSGYSRRDESSREESRVDEGRGDESRVDSQSISRTEGRAAPAPRAVTGQVTEIGRISEEFIDQKVTINGEILRAERLGKGHRLTVSDPTGEIQVILWDRVLTGVPTSELQQGRSLLLTGRVKSYRNQLEIQAESPDEIKVLGR